ncbi:hypothetical protein WJX73_003723 [Symbiochloris irregularis]|uniref:3-dehydroquinate synthase n=1 Tax=Symbiochloris irregularis TaxID=706552 RepID=A0AAW1PCD4_9CHLO
MVPSAVAERLADTQQAAFTTVPVDLGDRSYPIHIGSNLLQEGRKLADMITGSTALIVTNTTIAPLYLERCTEALKSAKPNLRVESVVLPDGEKHKSLEVLQQIYTRALELRLDRKTSFVALGGGVIGDMTGYAAASYQRGVNFVQVPTTVMATVDSSVGGKTGVNHPLGKNMIGAFYQPQGVLVDTSTLDTLPDRELASGLSEVIKYGLIHDTALFEWLEGNMQALLDRDEEALTYAIQQSCLNKARIVALDEREAGLRATLNLGHTFGHAIETWQGYGAWLHGEAVAVGTMMAAHMSVLQNWIEPSILDRTKKLLLQAKLPISPPPGMTPRDFMELMAVDKKAQDGGIRLILLKGPLGGCVITGDFSKEALQETLAEFCH